MFTQKSPIHAARSISNSTLVSSTLFRLFKQKGRDEGKSDKGKSALEEVVQGHVASDHGWHLKRW